jgi:hypothetical protein
LARARCPLPSRIPIGEPDGLALGLDRHRFGPLYSPTYPILDPPPVRTMVQRRHSVRRGFAVCPRSLVDKPPHGSIGTMHGDHRRTSPPMTLSPPHVPLSGVSSFTQDGACRTLAAKPRAPISRWLGHDPHGPAADQRLKASTLGKRWDAREMASIPKALSASVRLDVGAHGGSDRRFSAHRYPLGTGSR